MIHFLRPHFLYLLPVALLLWWLWQRRNDPMRGWRTVIHSSILPSLTMHAGDHPRRRGAGWLLGWLLAITALAGPSWRPAPSPFADDPTAAMILLKADTTMALTDLAPDRITRAQLEIKALAEQRSGQPLGLAAYAGTAHLVLPPTRDTAVVSEMAMHLRPDILPKPGDDLNAALALADRTLAESGGAILIVTDSVGGLPLTKPRWPVHFLAIARPDSPEWQSIQLAAKQLGGTAQLMTPDDTDIDALVRQLSSAPRMVDGADATTRWADDGYWLLIPIALLFLYHCRQTFSTREQPA